MRRQNVLVLRREDHQRDALGAIFLGAVTSDVEVRRYLERYLGSSIRVRHVELHDAVLRVTVESSGFESESQTLAKLGRAHLEAGRRRAASDMVGEALRLDPLNVDALKIDACLHLADLDFRGAHDRWVRAGEIRGYDSEILRGLAAVALREDRRPSAMRYLEEALVVSPDDRESASLLAELRRQVEIAFTDQPPKDEPGGGGE